MGSKQFRSKRKHPVRKIIFWSSLVVFVGFLVYAYINFNQILANALQKSFNSNAFSDVYELKFSKLRVNFFQGNITVKNVVIQRRQVPLHSYPYINSSFRLTTGEMHLRNVQLFTLINSGKLRLLRIEILLNIIIMKAIEFEYRLINLQGPLMKFAYSLTANEDDAKDLVQETFLKALKYCDKFVYEANFKGWICTIMRNVYINEYRRSFRYKMFSDHSKSEQSLNDVQPSCSEDPISIYRSKELQHIINSLHDDLRLPFKMYQEGFRYKEIAESLNMNIGTVKSRIFIARRKMIKQLN